MTTTPPVPPAEDPGVPVAQPKSRKTVYVVGGVVGAIAIVGGAAAWAATSFFGTGPQPATALPSSTVAYVSVDLDPNGSQKIAAFKLLRKFPGLAKQIGSTDDLREKIVDGVAGAAGCKVDFDTDVKPWLGNRAGFGLVGTNPVLALQVSDDGLAKTGLEKLVGCSKGHSGYVVDGDWALVASTSDIAKKADRAAQKGSLADDVNFQKWTKAAGDPGIASFYISPSIGDVAGDLFSTFESLAPAVPGVGDSSVTTPAAPSQSQLDELCSPSNLTASFTKQDCEKMFSSLRTSAASGDAGSGSSGSLGALAGANPFASCAGGSDPASAFKNSLASFKGAAGTLRVRGSGFELAEVGGGNVPATTTGHRVITSLPSDTAAAFGVSVPKEWGAELVANMKKACGDSFDPAKLFDPITQLTGLTFPDDFQTLLGSSAAISVGSGLDLEKLANSTDLSDLPVGIKVIGDPAKIKSALAKLHLPAGVRATYTDSGAVLSPDASYSSSLVKSGSLGDDGTFKDLVPNADDATIVLYLDGTRLRSAVSSAAGGDHNVTDNFDHFSGLGVSSWREGDSTHMTVRVNVS